MPGTIEFRGLSLFVLNEDNTLARVLIPRSTEKDTPRDGSPGKHADDTTAKGHHLGILIISDKNSIHKRIEPLKPGAKLTVTEAGGTSCAVDRFADVVSLSQVCNSGSADDLELLPGGEHSARVAASVEIKGGTLRGAKGSAIEWDLTDDYNPDHTFHKRKLTLNAQWTATRDVTLDVAGAGMGNDGSYPLPDKWRAYIYNVDKEKPVPKELDRDESCDHAQAHTLVDGDFKWLFQLLKPKSGKTLKQWLKGSTPRLPAPTGECPGKMVIKPLAKAAEKAVKAAAAAESSGAAPAGTAAAAAASNPTPDVSTCFPGSWGGP